MPSIEMEGLSIACHVNHLIQYVLLAVVNPMQLQHPAIRRDRA